MEHDSQHKIKLRKKHKQLLQLFMEGCHTYLAISNYTNVPYSTVVSFYHRNAGLPKPPRKPRKFHTGVLRNDYKKAYLEYKQGLSLAEIGQKYGNISFESVRKIFKEHGLKRRSKGRYRK